MVFPGGISSGAPDLEGHLGRARYTYRVAPQTSIFGDYVFVTRDFEDPGIDYDVKNPSVGITHAFSPTTNGSFQVGLFLARPATGRGTGWISVNANLNYPHPVYGLFHFSAGRLPGRLLYGFKFRVQPILWSVWVDQPSSCPAVFGRTDGVRGRDEYPSDEKLLRWEVRGNATYQPLRWLSFTLEALHRTDDSNLEGSDVQENRAICGLIDDIGSEDTTGLRGE